MSKDELYERLRDIFLPEDKRPLHEQCECGCQDNMGFIPLNQPGVGATTPWVVSGGGSGGSVTWYPTSATSTSIATGGICAPVPVTFETTTGDTFTITFK